MKGHSRAKQGLIVGAIVLLAVFTLQNLMGGPEAERAARSWLLSNAEVERRLGPNLTIQNFGLPGRCNLSWSPGSTIAEFRLQVGGEKGNASATIKMKKRADQWQVDDATLWTNEGGVSLE
jgi:hypothetical protein